MDKVAILHTNDLHSHFENWPKIKDFMDKRTRELEKQGYTVLKLDDGDALDRSNELTDVTSGRENTKLLNQAGYNGVTIGNNEALTTTHDELDHLYDQANFPVILDNVIDERTGGIPKWAKPYRDVKLPHGARIRIMGLTAPYDTYERMGWKALPIMPTIEKDLAKWRGQYDVMILLSHLGINNDRLIAEHFPEINVIIGGHTHHLLENGELVNKTLLTACEKWGHYVGEITFEVNDEKQVINKRARVYKTSEMAETDKERTYVKELDDKGVKLLKQKQVAYLPHPIKSSLTDDNEMIRLGLKAIEDKAGTNAAVLNNGLFLGNLKSGIVDGNDLHNLLPHVIHVMKTEFYGYDLWQMIREMEKNKGFLVHFQQKGMGFRGKYFGRLFYDGVSYDATKKQVFFQGKLVDPEQKYSIALLDHYNFIPFFPVINIVGDNHIYFDETLKDVFGDYLAKKFPLKEK